MSLHDLFSFSLSGVRERVHLVPKIRGLHGGDYEECLI
jgi:hypothetical protein